MWDISKKKLNAYDSKKFDFDDVKIGDKVIVEVNSIQNFYEKSIKKGEVIHLRKGVHFTIKVNDGYGYSNETVMRSKIFCKDVKVLYHEIT